MFPHADTTYTIQTLDYQERLRTAAQQRRAASAQTGAHARPLHPQPGVRVVAAWLRAWGTRLPGAMRVVGPLTTG
jgi:hypothetical protein